MRELFGNVLSVAAGFAIIMLFSHIYHVDWQLMLMSIRDATQGRFMPTFSLVFGDMSPSIKRLVA